NETFDVVYTSKGVINWLRDINEWGRIISGYLKPGGFFYIMELHPVKFMFDDTIKNELKIKYSYFHKNEPVCFDDEYPDYSDKNYIPKNPTFEWNWTLSDIINSLINAGLKIEFVREYDKLFYNGLPGMEKDENGWWFLPGYKGMIPLTYTIKAVK
ncbi:MAG: SAM-dependent methyltransferase, partial [Spirochaetes bacterium]|nr:SAM-dependent methyltransferase [Spirochaetota bacterium]